MGEELNSLSLMDLRELAKSKGLKGLSKLNKEELINQIMSEVKKKDEVLNDIDDLKVDENVDISNKKLELEGATLNSKDDFVVEGVLEVLPDGFGFLRGENYLSTQKDVYVSPVQIRRFRLDTGDKVKGIARLPKETEKFSALIYVNTVNGDAPEVAMKRRGFDDLTPIFPNKRIHLETVTEEYSNRIIDLMAPIGFGQRGMIVSPPKVRKDYLTKEISK